MLQNSKDIKEIFTQYVTGMINWYEFIIIINDHNSTCHDTLKVDVVAHSKKTWFMYQNDIVEITIQD